MLSWRSIIVATTCSALLLLQLFGVHVHREVGHPHADPTALAAHHAHADARADVHADEAAAGHVEHLAHGDDDLVVVSQHDLHHASAHHDAGALDLDIEQLAGSGGSSLLLPMAPGVAARSLRVDGRRSVPLPAIGAVPIRTRASYFTPPSQAPPQLG